MAQRDALNGWLELISKAPARPTSEAIAQLGQALVKLSMNNIFQVPERIEVFDTARTTLLSIPGHARFFANRVVEARKSSTDFVADGEYHKVCENLRETLRQLPSPETVQVLGGMLKSDEDVPTREQIIHLRTANFKGADLKWFCPSELAATTLLELGIRGFPRGTGIKKAFLRTDLPLMREWWEEVESGKRTFFFVGQDVEYRFKPDGTWETIAISNPPGDGPRRPDFASAQRPEKRPAPVAAAEHPKPAWNRNVWIRVSAAAAALVALVAWIFLNRRKA